MVDIVVGIPPDEAEGAGFDAEEGGVREMRAKKGKAVVESEAETWYPSESETLPPHKTMFLSRIQATTSGFPKVSLLKT